MNILIADQTDHHDHPHALLTSLLNKVWPAATVRVTNQPDQLKSADLYIPILNNVPGLIDKLPLDGPTIALSGLPELKELAEAMGVTCFPLPFNVRAFLDELEKYLGPQNVL